jgi:hypothetical protein
MIRPCVIFGTLGGSSAVVIRELSVSSEVSQMLDDISSTMLGDPAVARATDFGSQARAVEGHMDIVSAANMVAHKQLPPEVENMVQLVGKGDRGSKAPEDAKLLDFDEDSLEKARIVLNEMIVDAWKELDEKILQCKYFENMNRENYGQVTRDMARLIEQINDLERVESEAVEGINTKDMEIKAVEDLIEKETREYMKEYNENSAELTIRQNDMDVFQFIMQFTKCKEGAILRTEEDLGLAQLKQSDPDNLVLAQVKVCETAEGKRVFKFDDQDQDEKYQKMLTPAAKRQLDYMLRAAAPSLIQHKAAPANTGNSSSDALGAHIAKVAVRDGVSTITASLKCDPDMTPDCALLHDKLSLLWGEFKDQVDELTMIMMKNEYEFHELKTNLNNQIDVLKTAKARLNELLGEARSNLAADNEEKKQKEVQKRELDESYYAEMLKCKKRINWIFYQDICAIRIVRNAVLEASEVCNPRVMIDCDVGAWVAEECSKPCDDNCPSMSTGNELSGLAGHASAADDMDHQEETGGAGDRSNTFEDCGGWQEMRREVVVPQDELTTQSGKIGCGVPCPMTNRYQKCGQFHCPVNCVMSAWSGWSKCSAECGGGLQGHTRSIMMKPKNGGTSCNTVEESQPCGTGSCDRDCLLSRWTGRTPCSMACDPGNGATPGMWEQRRHVVRPTRGFGRCPTATSRFRYRRGSCNTHACYKDEICVAKQDLVVAIDGSGSVRTAGFNILKKFVKKMLSRYQTEYWGDDAVKLGIVLFGNGEIMKDGKTVSPAILEQPLTFSMESVMTKLDGLEFKRGFTNMAQALSMAETAFIMGSRRTAQAAIMVVTDGKPSFKFQTNEMVEQLDDKGIQRYMLLVNDEGIGSDSNTVMRSWAQSAMADQRGACSWWTQSA